MGLLNFVTNKSKNVAAPVHSTTAPEPNMVSEDCPAVSIIVPIFNEEESIPDLHAGLLHVANSLGAEVIVVDDGSDDDTSELLQHCRGFNLLRIPHGGKSAALAAGLARARAPIAVTIDADLQEDPAHIPHMVSLVKQGFDCVHGIRVCRQDDFGANACPPGFTTNLSGCFSAAASGTLTAACVPLSPTGCAHWSGNKAPTAWSPY